MANEKYEAYCDVYSFLHYDYNPDGKTKAQIIQDIKAYCFKKAKESETDKG